MPFLKHLFNNYSGDPMLGDEMSDLVSIYKPKYDDDVMESLQLVSVFHAQFYLEKSLTFISN